MWLAAEEQQVAFPIHALTCLFQILFNKLSGLEVKHNHSGFFWLVSKYCIDTLVTVTELFFNYSCFKRAVLRTK